MTELKVVGKSVLRVDALEKVTGKAKFCSDFKMPGMLHAKILRSPHPHARILRIDASRAEKLPGVRAIVSGKDAPDIRIGMLLLDQYVLCRDNIVRCVGEPVAAVAANTVEIAEEAVDLIEVDYEELPAVFDPEAAMKKDCPAIIHPDLAHYKSPLPMLKWRTEPEMPNVLYHFMIRQGDTEQGFQEADVVVENRFSTAKVGHCPIEPHQSIAWVEADGSLVVRTKTQQASELRLILARLFGLPPSKVRVIAPYVGGAFGDGSGVMTEPITILLAMKTGRPVSLVYTREEMFVDGRQQVAFVTYIKDGAKRDGTLVAREMRSILDCGRHSEMALIVVKNSSFGAVGTYRIPSFKLDSYGVYTNNPLTGTYRGLGSPQIVWAVEQQMDILAEKLGLDPVEIRMKNILNEGERDVCGQIAHSIGVKKCLDKVAEWIESGEKAEEGLWRRGRGIAIGNKYTVGATSSVATVIVHPDETIEVRHGTDEIGQGANTVVAQIAAEEFGVSIDSIKVVRGDSAFCPYDFGAVSSRSTFHVGNAVRRACQDARRQIFDMAAAKLEVTANDLETREGKVFVIGWPDRWLRIADLFSPQGVSMKGGEIIGTGAYTGRIILEDLDTGQSAKMVMSYAHAAHAVEVAVNIETGEVKVLRFAGAFDTVPINPKMAEGQIEGGIIQGIGAALYEKIVVSNGVVVNPSFMDYKIPSATVPPANENLKAMLAETPHREGPFGAKGLGESTMVPTLAAIANAVYRATGVRIRDLPIAREKVLTGLKEREKVALAR